MLKHYWLSNLSSLDSFYLANFVVYLKYPWVHRFVEGNMWTLYALLLYFRIAWGRQPLSLAPVTASMTIGRLFTHVPRIYGYLLQCYILYSSEFHECGCFFRVLITISVISLKECILYLIAYSETIVDLRFRVILCDLKDKLSLSSRRHGTRLFYTVSFIYLPRTVPLLALKLPESRTYMFSERARVWRSFLKTQMSKDLK